MLLSLVPREHSRPPRLTLAAAAASRSSAPKCGARTMACRVALSEHRWLRQRAREGDAMATATKATRRNGRAAAKPANGKAVPHLSVNERVARGKAARKEVPRAGHAF